MQREGFKNLIWNNLQLAAGKLGLGIYFQEFKKESGNSFWYILRNLVVLSSDWMDPQKRNGGPRKPRVHYANSNRPGQHIPVLFDLHSIFCIHPKCGNVPVTHDITASSSNLADIFLFGFFFSDPYGRHRVAPKPCAPRNACAMQTEQ